MEIDYINGPKTDKIFGMSKYQLEIVKRLNVDLNFIEFDSLMIYFDKKFNNSSNSISDLKDKDMKISNENQTQKFVMDLGKKFIQNIDRYRYTKTVNKRVKEHNIKHITTQEFAYIQNSLEMDKTIITCHDLIPWVYENDRSKFWKDNINGLKKADTIITISEFSKNEIIKNLDYPPKNIHIVKDAVDHSRYYLNRNKHISNQFNISDNQKIVLYVGSEMPRQNVPNLIKAFALLKKKVPDIKLVKIGESQSYGARNTILKLIKELDLQNDVKFIGYVPEEDMPKWYNASDILVYPCDYAGFGLPPLEAMACGTPVITSDTTSLPEVVGGAGIMIDPKDVKLMSDKMYDVLTDNALNENMVTKGLKRVKLFNWDESAQKTKKIYDTLI
jgi:glycosyltransferase involved in cell wall biosynthesis